MPICKDCGRDFRGSGDVCPICRVEIPEVSPLTQGYISEGDELCEQSRFEEACEKFAEAVRQKPDFADAYHNWGVALDHLGRTEEAEEKLEIAERLRS